MPHCPALSFTILLTPSEGEWYRSFVERKVTDWFAWERGQRHEPFWDLQHVGLPGPNLRLGRLCSHHAGSVSAQADLQPLVGRKHSSETKEKKATWSFDSSKFLHTWLLQVSVTPPCDTYLQVNQQDRCAVIKGHLFKVCIPGLTRLRSLRPGYSERRTRL